MALFQAEITRSQEVNLEGQVIGWTGARYDEGWAMQVGGRYFPEINFKTAPGKRLLLEGEFSADIFGSWTTPDEGDKFYGSIKPYRAWLKTGNDQFEIRAGLQKINFGSASMLRSLMWFDRIDPRDPLQLTEGVYGLLGRYYFLNNTNIWLWGLYGNKGTKGWEYLESNWHRPEFGGRVQFPVPRTEMAFTYHNREVKDTLSQLSGSDDPFSFTEQKFAFDAKADLVIGLWFEGSLKYSNTDLIPSYEKMITLGADYTFGIGNGLHLLVEYFGMSTSEKFSAETTSSLEFVGFSASYPLSMVIGLSAIVYYNPENNDLYRFANISLTYDSFSFFLMGFWNPSSYQLFNMETESTLYSGAGINVMAVFNY
ncbi:MAG: hypothetical protein E4G95_01565 [Bacteroidia bacterium]|nr:MAG: hypothetical protein E4G95_01565 [Bacteroidia bacterium]